MSQDNIKDSGEKQTVGEIILAARKLHKDRRGAVEERREERKRPLTPPLLEPNEEDGLTTTPSAMSHQEELQEHIS